MSFLKKWLGGSAGPEVSEPEASARVDKNAGKKLNPLGIADVESGGWVVDREYGLMQVVSTDGTSCRLKRHDDDGETTFSSSLVDKRLHPVVTEVAAKEIQATITSGGDPLPEAGDDIAVSISIEEHLRQGDFVALADTLRGIYQVRGLLTDLGAKAGIASKIETALFPQLALVEGCKPATMRRRMRKGQPAFGYLAPEREDLPLADPPPAPKGWEPGDSFCVYDGLAVGDNPMSENDKTTYKDGTRCNILVQAVPGVWHTYMREDDSCIITWAVAHETIAASFDALLKDAKALGIVNCDGGAVHVVDQEVRDDADYQMALGEGHCKGRGAALGMGGDGANLVATITGADGATVLVVVTDPDDAVP